MRGAGLGMAAAALVAACGAGGASGAEAPALAAGGAAAATAGAPRVIALDEALAMARERAPAAIRARGDVRAGRAQVRSALGAFLPNLTLSAGSTRSWPEGEVTRIVDGEQRRFSAPRWSYGASLSSSVELFAGGRRLFELRQARAQLDAAEAGAVAGLFGVDLAVKAAYFDVLAARESEAAARAQLAQAELQRRTAVARLRAARATKSDSLRAEIQVGNATLAVLQARQDIATAEAALARVIGSPQPVTAADEPPAAREAAALDEAAIARLAAEGPAVAEARAQRDAARAAARAAWTDYLPSLSASYSRSGSGTGQETLFGEDDLFAYNGSLRLSLSLPVFDRFAREAQAVSASVALDNAEAALRDAELAARESVVRDLGALRTAEERERVQTASVAAAEEDLRAQQRRYELGESTLLDVLTSQTQLDEARQALIRARYDRRVALAQLEALVGRSLAGGEPARP
uniref:TolC family protein n=1 Tax=Eiseniibacteriota bacterium TaxID=2212470 RepID=A0A832MLM4_UNCEI